MPAHTDRAVSPAEAPPLVVLTRPVPLAAERATAEAQAARLRAAGLRLAEYPLSTIDIDPAALGAAVSDVLQQPVSIDCQKSPVPAASEWGSHEPVLLILGSPSAIAAFGPWLAALDARDCIAVPGSASAARLEALGTPAQCIVGAAPQRAADAEALLEQLRRHRARRNLPGRVCLLHGGGSGAEAIEAGLRALGLTPTSHRVYRQQRLPLSAQRMAQLAELAAAGSRAWVLSQSPACAWLAEELSAIGAADALGAAVAIHPRIAAAARAAGFAPVIETDGTTLDAVPAALGVGRAGCQEPGRQKSRA